MYKYIKQNGSIDRFLAFIDAKTGGRADWFQRLFSFLVVGGLGAIANLICFSAFYYPLTRPLNGFLAYCIAFPTATELSILLNFVLNDRITFRNLKGHDRPWQVRCMRFHMTGVGGALVTFIISFSCLHLLHVPAFLSQGIALVTATIFNFAFHHIFTYHHTPEMKEMEGSKQQFEEVSSALDHLSETYQMAQVPTRGGDNSR